MKRRTSEVVRRSLGRDQGEGTGGGFAAATLEVGTTGQREQCPGRLCQSRALCSVSYERPGGRFPYTWIDRAGLDRHWLLFTLG